MSRNLRSALHQAADLIVDALEAEAREQRISEPARRKPARRGQRPVGESAPADRKAAEEFLSGFRDAPEKGKTRLDRIAATLLEIDPSTRVESPAPTATKQKTPKKAPR